MFIGPLYLICVDSKLYQCTPEKGLQVDPFPDAYQETRFAHILTTGVNSDSPPLALAAHRDPSNLRAVFQGL